MRRKHRVLVEVTFDKRVTAKTAASFIRRSLDMEMNTAISELNISCDAYHVKEAERVIQAELRNRWRVLTSRNSADRLGKSDGGSSEGET